MTATMSKTMQKAYDELVRKVNEAREAGSFGVWFFGSDERYEEARAKDSRFNVTTYDMQNEYNLALDGIVECGCKTNTAVALANRGLIEFAGKNRVKVLGI